MNEEKRVDKPNNDPQEPTEPTGQLDLKGKDPADLVEQHVKDNYAALNDMGRPYSQLADEAGRMGDRVLEAYLKGQRDSDAYREHESGERERAAAERGEQTKDPSKTPTNRNARSAQQQNG